MDAEEREIYFYLKSWKSDSVSEQEISRRAGGRHKFERSHDWAKSVLHRMLERSIVEIDHTGHYRLKPRPTSSAGKRRWISPQIAKILKDSGKNFGDSGMSDEESDMDAYYESL
jgi:hypothetical protein